MEYIRVFQSQQDAEQQLAQITHPTLSAVRGGGFIGLRPGGSPVPPGPDYSEPFYIDVRGAVTLVATSGLQMSTDKTNWTDTTAMILPTGKTYFRVATDQSTPLQPNWTEDSNSDYDIGGNINSLVKTSFENDTTCYKFYSNYEGFFQGKSKIKSAGGLILPATTLINECYASMFRGCTSLTTAPALPATTLAIGCYDGMFYECTALTATPELVATILVEDCYIEMFKGCESLNEITIYANDISADSCLNDWVYNVANEGTFNNMGSAIYPVGSSGNPWRSGPGPLV